MGRFQVNVRMLALASMLAVGLTLVLGPGIAPAQHKACPAVPGMTEKECKEYKPSDWKPGRAVTYWYDTDGIDPGVAGCHVEVKGPTDRTPTGRSFPEGCLGGILIESNPGANEIHEHGNDVGNPNYVNCANWCKEVKKTKGGACITVSAGPAEPKVAPCKTSARCECK